MTEIEIRPAAVKDAHSMADIFRRPYRRRFGLNVL